MRTLLILASTLLLSLPLAAQAPTPAQTQSDLHSALLGDWTGVLEYRDYSEPPTSTKRVDLPTWLTIARAPTGPSLTWHYIYDDGPTKTVQETDLVLFDVPHSTYTESSNGKPTQPFTVTGYDTLRLGRGTLILTGPSTDNDQPSETRLTLTIRRNLLDILEEVRPAQSTQPFAFRHSFRFVRATPPTTK